jgi:hypothetical protein
VVPVAIGMYAQLQEKNSNLAHGVTEALQQQVIHMPSKFALLPQTSLKHWQVESDIVVNEMQSVEFTGDHMKNRLVTEFNCQLCN